MAGQNVNVFTDDNFDSEVLRASGPVLVDFWAPWCGPCRQISPMIDELAGENPDVKIGKMNIDDSPMTPQRYGVSSIPTLMIFRDGQVADMIVGIRPKAHLQRALDSSRV
jgi:thioredoxin 1